MVFRKYNDQVIGINPQIFWYPAEVFHAVFPFCHPEYLKIFGSQEPIFFGTGV
jgi:hypothetical protein